MTFRPHPWFNDKTKKPMFGIQAKIVGAQVSWMHCAEGSKPLIYKTEAERDAKLKELRKAEREKRKQS